MGPSGQVHANELGHYKHPGMREAIRAKRALTASSKMIDCMK